VELTNLFVLCDVCSSPNVFDSDYEKWLRYTAWVKCEKCGQKMNLTDEVKRAGWNV
jgi:hypothetical protein